MLRFGSVFIYENCVSQAQWARWWGGKGVALVWYGKDDGLLLSV